jgi:hypothetical protein
VSWAATPARIGVPKTAIQIEIRVVRFAVFLVPPARRRMMPALLVTETLSVAPTCTLGPPDTALRRTPLARTLLSVSIVRRTEAR